MTVRIIDTHQHLWDLDKIELPWVIEVPELNRSFLNSDYQDQTAAPLTVPLNQQEYRIEKTIYMEVDAAEQDMEKETDLIIGQCRNESLPQVGLVAAARPESNDFSEKLDRLKAATEVKGVRRVLHTDSTPAQFCLQSQFIESLKLLGECDLNFDICIRREELSDVVQLCQSCPQTQFVLDHCGNADCRIGDEEFQSWKTQIREIAKNENIVCKVSGFGWTIQKEDWTFKNEIEPILRVVFEAFGEDRVLFGGDWPVCTLSKLSFQEWMACLIRFTKSFSDSATEKLFWSNAHSVYRV